MTTLFKFVSTRNRNRVIFCLIIGAILTAPTSRARSATVEMRDEDGDKQLLYRGSYALLVGVSRYTNGWQNLDQIPDELRKAKEALESHGFEVTLELERTSARELRDVYQDFINQYGYDHDNRLVFIFSGHGHTWVGGNQGYLVPSDAPKPASDENPGVSFLRKTIHISQMLEWSRQMTAKHALFLFDSCFSGTIFQTRGPDSAPKPSKFRFESASRPVRQFITAGSANETVPAKSVFMPAFVDAIMLGEGDYSGDGIVTGNELGLYLENEVPQYSEQSPQFGRHPVRDYAKGNFVFVLDSRNVNVPDRPVVPKEETDEFPRSDTPVVAPSVRTTPVDNDLVTYTATLGGEALFDNNSDRLNASSEQAIADLASQLSKFQEITAISVVGHTDATGAASHNQSLSERRAAAVEEFLKAAYPDVDISSSGMGEDSPVATNSTPGGRQLNRRVEVQVTAKSTTE